MGVELNPATSGPMVNESLETVLEGVFACGNVLHVPRGSLPLNPYGYPL